MKTFGHSQLVAGYALLLARELGLENVRSLADVERGALLHDIGKIGIAISRVTWKGRSPWL